MTDFEEMKKVVSDAYHEYAGAYRIGETPENLLPPRNEYPDVVSYIAAKVIEHGKT